MPQKINLRKGQAPKTKKTAPLAQEETDESSEEHTEDEEPRTSKKKSAIVISKKQKKNDKSMVAFKFEINDENHTFHSLHNKTGSVAIDEIITKDFNEHNVR